MAALILPAFNGRTSGNRQAMFFWQHELTIWKNSSTNNLRFDFNSLLPEDKHRTIAFGSYWNAWIQTNYLWNTPSNREIVVVCGRQYDNVHKLGFWNFFIPNPAHVVGYSDGTVGLISPTEFTNLNLNRFVSAVSLVTNSEFKISKP